MDNRRKGSQGGSGNRKACKTFSLNDTLFLFVLYIFNCFWCGLSTAVLSRILSSTVDRWNSLVDHEFSPFWYSMYTSPL